MKKSDGIYLMQSLGLNTLDCLITKKKDDAFAYLHKNHNIRISLRTERGEEFGCPFYYGKIGGGLVDLANQHIEEGYTLLLYPYLDYKDSIAYGTVGLPPDGSTIIEFVEGPGLVRELDTNPTRISITVPPGLALIPNRPLISEVVKEVKELCYNEQACIVEWSIYKYSVGILQKPVIYWELRDYA